MRRPRGGRSKRAFGDRFAVVAGETLLARGVLHARPEGGGVGSDSGQAAVEAALVLPWMVLAGLGILQLSSLQQARILTGYAAFNAARAGVVWAGHAERMRDAALFSLLPAWGRTDGFGALAATWRAARAEQALFEPAFGASARGLPSEFDGLLGRVRVAVVQPSAVGEEEGGEEIAFDVPAAPGQQAERERSVLEVRVRYLHELRMPFAGAILFASWFMARAPSASARPPGSLPDLAPSETAALWGWATGSRRRFFIPLFASYRMRMQSNFHKRWLMRSAGGRGAPP